MTDVAKRRVTETWREAVGSRAGIAAPACLAAYDGLVAEGSGEAEAAFRALGTHRLLWRVDEPYDPPETRAGSGATGTGEDGMPDL
ncbi:hypothetical protein [uncultured Enterovirga sp.]|uniref:hypothetical protein n=1 Tax=uncultured Enterovirga sp. TaxID=2026352 RepID=UPI0035CC35B6